MVHTWNILLFFLKSSFHFINAIFQKLYGMNRMKMIVRQAGLLLRSLCGTFVEGPLTLSRMFVARVQGHITQLKRMKK